METTLFMINDRFEDFGAPYYTVVCTTEAQVKRLTDRCIDKGLIPATRKADSYENAMKFLDQL